MKKYILLLILILFLGYLFYPLFHNTIKNKIMDGELQYSIELGWINWDHAKPEGTIDAMKLFHSKNHSVVDTFLYCYSQKMKYKIFNSYYVAEVEECRKLQSSNSLEEEQAIFFELFLSVSNSFEKMQSKFPFMLIRDSNNSSFRAGDLTGNLISYYLAVSGKSIAEMKESLSLLDAEHSYEIYQTEGLGQVYWENIVLNSKQTSATLVDLKGLIERINYKERTCSVLTQSETKFYLED